MPMLRSPGYGASKAALHHFILALRTQLRDGPGNAKVVESYPPAVQTELHDANHQPDFEKRVFDWYAANRVHGGNVGRSGGGQGADCSGLCEGNVRCV